VISLATAPSPLSLLGEHWSISWVVCGPAGALLVLYLSAVARLSRASGGRRWPVRRTAAFAGGVLVLVVALQSGVDAYDDRLLSAHMVQHLLLLLLGPLLLLEGRPLILALRVAGPARRASLLALLGRGRPLARPAACLAVFSVGVVAVHLPAVFDAALEHPLLHVAEHGLMIALGVLFWSPLVDVDPAPRHRLAGLGRVLYLLASMPAMALVGAYLNRATSIVYRPYGAAAHTLGISAVADQQQAGAIMWVAGSTFMIAVGLWLAMRAMVLDDRRQARRERRAEELSVALPLPGPGR
jgi:putative membrane protein